MPRVQRMFDATQKADTVRRDLRDKLPVSELAAELDAQPNLIHQLISQVRMVGRAGPKEFREEAFG
jgi:hypothetical protein